MVEIGRIYNGGYMEYIHMTGEKRDLIDNLQKQIRDLEYKQKIHIQSIEAFEKCISEKQEILFLLIGAGHKKDELHEWTKQNR